MDEAPEEPNHKAVVNVYNISSACCLCRFFINKELLLAINDSEPSLIVRVIECVDATVNGEDYGCDRAGRAQKATHEARHASCCAL